jgi:hypothetical protein
MTILNDDSRVINKLESSLTDDARVIIYDCHMLIVQATGTLTEREGSVQLIFQTLFTFLQKQATLI